MPTLVVTDTPTESPTVALVETAPVLPSAPAYIRLIHAAPETDSVDIYMGSFLVASRLSFGVNTDRTEVPSGDYVLRVVRNGSSAEDSPLYETPLNISAQASLLLVFTGTADALTVVSYDESTEPLGVNESRITAIHAVPRGLDFTLRQENSDLTSAVSFGMSTAAVVTSGSVTLQFQAGETTLFSYPAELRAGFNYTLVLVGRSNDPNSLAVVAFENRVPGLIQVRTIHAASDLGAVDFYLDGERISSGVEYSRTSERIPAAAGRRLAAVYAAGADTGATAPLYSQYVDLQENTNLSLILLGTATSLRLLPFVEDLSPTPEGQVRLSFVNTIEDVSVVRVENMNGTLADVAYAQQGRDATFSAGTYTLFWNTVTGTPDTLEIGSELQFEAGRVYLYLFTGRDLSNPPLIFSENVGVEDAPAVDTTTQARFVNAIPTDATVDFVVDGNVVASSVAYGQSSELVTLQEHEGVVTIRSGGVDVTSSEYDFNVSTHHTVIAYGDSADIAQIRGLPDTFAVEADAASVRLINVSRDSLVEFGLAYSLATVSTSIEVATETVEPVFRSSLPLDTQIIIESLGNQSGEFIVDTVAIPAGMRDVFVLDATTQQVAAYIAALNLEAGQHYDIIAFQSSNSAQVRAFVIHYPIIDP
ncbi:MAG: DUF4397 domain-containing protein [Anaerolineae bacterium]